MTTHGCVPDLSEGDGGVRFCANTQECVQQLGAGHSCIMHICQKKRGQCINGESCTLPNRKGLCQKGRIQCQGTQPICTPLHQPKKEVCGNQVDDDCDGTIDNPKDCECKPGESRECYPKDQKGCTEIKPSKGTYKCTGNCSAGKQLCGVDAQWGACERYTLPQKENCNGKDDDCNGKIDDDFPSAQAPCGVLNRKGPCAVGKVVCISGRTECEQTVKPKAQDDCANAIDDDCDGQINNGCICRAGETKECYNAKPETKNKGLCKAGKVTCSPKGKWGACVDEILPKTEECDGQDNDCDGQIDESFSTQGAPCTDATRHGPCQKGKKICTNGNIQCKPDQTPQPEICDNIDNDCNGTIDDTKGGCGCTKDQTKPCGSSRGECRQGTQTCNANGQWQACVGEQKATPEICNGKDDNCDGKIDNVSNTSNPLTKNCYTGPPSTQNIGICKGGVQSCTAGVWGPCTGEVKPQTEIPGNGIDEDCNGKDAPPASACADGSNDQIWSSGKMVGCDCSSSPCTAQAAKSLCAPGWRICNVTDWKANYANQDSDKVRFIAAVMRNCDSVSACPCQKGYLDCKTTPVTIEDAPLGSLCEFSCKSHGSKDYHWSFFVGPKSLLGKNIEPCKGDWSKPHNYIKGLIGRGNYTSVLQKYTQKACLSYSFKIGTTSFASGVMCCK